MNKIATDERLGTHWLVDFSSCQTIPSEPDQLQEIMEDAARRCKATVVCSTFHRFEPQGLSGVVVIGESHLAVHTWPEHASVCVDLFTCSDQMDAEPGIEYLTEMFAARETNTRIVARGKPAHPSSPSGP